MGTPINKQSTSGPINGYTIGNLEAPKLADIEDFMVAYDIPQSGDPVIDTGAVKQFVKATQTDETEYLKKAIYTQESLDALKEMVRGQREKAEKFDSAFSATAERMLTLDDPLYNPAFVDSLVNEAYAYEALSKKIEEEWDEATYGGIALDGLDRYLLRQTTIGMFEDVTERGQRLTEEITTARISMSPDEFKEFFDSKLDEMAREGITRGKNVFAYFTLLSAVQNAGMDPNKNLDKALGFFDIATIGAAPAMKLYRAAKNGAKAYTTIRKIARLRTTDEAGEVAAKIIEKEVVPPLDVLDDAESSVLKVNSAPPELSPNLSRVERAKSNNAIIRALRTMWKKGTFGRTLTTEEAVKMVSKWKTQAAETHGHRVLYADIDTSFSNRVQQGVLNLGTKRGTPYANEQVAKRELAKMDTQGQDLKVIENPDGDGYVIQFRSNIALDEYVTPLPVEKAFALKTRDFLNRLFSSNTATDDTINNALALRGEAGGNMALEIMNPQLKLLRGIKGDGRKAIDNAFSDFRDNPDYLDLKAGYTLKDLTSLVEKHLATRKATEKEVEALQALMDIEEATWFLKAEQMLHKFVAMGAKHIYFPLRKEGTIAKRIDNKLVSPETKVLTKEGVEVTAGQLNETDTIWRLQHPVEPKGPGFSAKEYLYVTGVDKVEELTHDAVLGFAAGGRRIRPNARYFIASMGKRPKAFMVALTEQQAKSASNELNRIREAIVRGVDGDELDKIVLDNSSWSNGSVKTAQEFEEYFALDRQIDLETPFDYKARGDNYVSELDSFENSLGIRNWDEYVAYSKNRSDDLLDEYGGATAYDVNALDSILQQSSSVILDYARSAYTVRATSSWAAKAKAFGVRPPAGVSPNDSLNFALYAEVNGTGAHFDELRHMQDVIRRRMNTPSRFETTLKRVGDSAMEWVFNKSKVNLFQGMSNIQQKLLTFNFHSTLGMFGVDQLILQSMHTLNVMAMDPANALKASSLIPAVRMMANMEPDMQKAFMRNLHKHGIIKSSDLEELMEYVRTTGRNLLGSDVAEHGTAMGLGLTNYLGEGWKGVDKAAFYASRGGKELLDAGLVFFNQGELTSRYMSMITAWLQYKKIAKTAGSSLTEEGRTWIMNKDSALSFNMTTASRAKFQSGLMKIPTQWMSYMRGTLEAGLVGRYLTKGERARLAASQLVFFGATGYGLGGYVEDLGEALGADYMPAGEASYRIAKWGLVDFLLSESGEMISKDTAIQTASAERFSPVHGIVEMARNIYEDPNIASIALGPTGSVAGGAVKNVWDIWKRAVENKPVVLTEEIMETLRTIRSLDNTMKAIGIIKNGTYISKTGSLAPVDGLSTADAVYQYLGFKPAQIAFAQELTRDKFRYNESMRNFESELSKRMEKVYEMLDSDDPEERSRAGKLGQEILDIVDLSPFSSSDRLKMKKRLARMDQSRVLKLTSDALQREATYDLEALRKISGEK